MSMPTRQVPYRRPACASQAWTICAPPTAPAKVGDDSEGTRPRGMFWPLGRPKRRRGGRRAGVETEGRNGDAAYPGTRAGQTRPRRGEERGRIHMPRAGTRSCVRVRVDRCSPPSQLLSRPPARARSDRAIISRPAPAMPRSPLAPFPASPSLAASNLRSIYLPQRPATRTRS